MTIETVPDWGILSKFCIYLLQIFTDRELVYGIHKGLQAHSEIAPTYGGLYAYKTKNSVAGIIGVNKDDYGKYLLT
jgi:hypothetical protein